jgi:hypothetical protein
MIRATIRVEGKLFMRVRIAILFTIVFCAGAAAQEVSETSVGWWQSLDDDTRYEVQADLILTGHYHALVDGEFGPLTFNAIAEYQETARLSGTAGILSRSDLAHLKTEAEKIFEDLGMALVSDENAGVSAFAPRSILSSEVRELEGGVTYSSSDGEFIFFLQGWDDDGTSLAGARDEILRAMPTLTVTYQTNRPNRVVVSGRDGAASFYTMLHTDGKKIVGFTVIWSEKYASTGTLAAMFAASYSGDSTLFEQSTTEKKIDERLPAETQSGPNGEWIGPFFLPDADETTIALAGDIKAGAALDFIRAYRKRPTARVVTLSSNGGSVDEGLLVAHQVHDKGLATHVPAGTGCYSACAYIFFAGKERMADGELGVHQIYGDGVSAADAQIALSDVLDALEDFDVPQEVVSSMLRTRPEDMHIFTERELAALEKGPLRPDKAGVGQAANEKAVTAPDLAVAHDTQSLLLEASDNNTTGAVPFFGDVEWTLGTDELGQLTLVGKAHIPGRGLTADLLIRKNLNAKLPASHLIEIGFDLPPGFVGGSIAGIPGVLPKNQELGRGEPLTGVSARIEDNSFVIALSNRKSERVANLKLLSSPWIDVALIYGSGRRAILTFEKDERAEKLFAEAINAWDSLPYVVSEAAEVTEDGLKSFISDLRTAEALPQDVGNPLPVANDTRAAVTGDPTAGYGYVGVWSDTHAACAKIDQHNSGRFAVLTRATFRDGPHAYFGNFGPLVDGTMRITVRSSSGTRKVFLRQTISGSLDIDGRSYVRCTTVATTSDIAAAPEVPKTVDMGL